MKPYYQDESVTIYNADCRDVLPQLKADVVFADPPYANGTDYASYDDTKENLTTLVNEALPLMRESAPVVLVTPGVGNMFDYPKPTWTLAWALTASGAGGCSWGFPTWQPVLAYGKDPYLQKGLGRRPDSKISGSGVDSADAQLGVNTIAHPCPKPLFFMRWIITRSTTSANTTILDPFMGSGTTLRAAKDLGRKAIGIELEERYCEIAAKRMSQLAMEL